METDPWRDITIVIVTHNSSRIIESCLVPLRGARRVVVVDNASRDDTCDRVRRVLGNAEIIRNSSNAGFGAAVNRGVARADTPFVLLLSPDTIVGGETVRLLIEAAHAYAEAALIAPYLTDSAGMVELSWMGPFEHNHHPATVFPENPFCTWFVMAAVLLIRVSAWRHVTGFDERIFLYGEDVDLCLRFSKARFGLVIVPTARAQHSGGQSSRFTWRVRWRRDWHMTWGHLYIEARHGDPKHARVEARALALRHAAKVALYLLLINPKRIIGNLAKVSAALAFLINPPRIERN
jgi:GT2 family glycosyltransferase